MSKLVSVVVVILAIVVSGIIIMGRIVPSMVSSTSTSEVILGIMVAIVWIFVTIGFFYTAIKKLFNGDSNEPQ